jgi:hypothetical protein
VMWKLKVLLGSADVNVRAHPRYVSGRPHLSAADRVSSSMNKRVYVKVTDSVLLAASRLAAARDEAEMLHSPHPAARGGPEVPCGARGLNQVGRLSFASEARLSIRARPSDANGAWARSSGRQALIALP